MTTQTDSGVRVRRLGHVGLYVRDLPMMRDWYRDTLGLTVTDEGADLGIVFLSARPDEEHHELALARGRETDDSLKMVQQVSWQVDSVEEVRAFHRRFQEKGVPVEREITHGNALAIYFFDPEGNRNEVYCQVDEDCPQPFGRPIDLDRSVDEILAENKRLIAAR
jgi:catechol-2,3-dioxygenase